jgi:hypothetical protein
MNTQIAAQRRLPPGPEVIFTTGVKYLILHLFLISCAKAISGPSWLTWNTAGTTA